MAATTNRGEILDFLAEGETYPLPNGTKLNLNLPTVSDLVKFQKLAKESEPDDEESVTRLPLFLLQAVTKDYGFDDDQALKLYSKTGGLNGGLAKKVYSLFGMDSAVESGDEPGAGSTGATDYSTPTE